MEELAALGGLILSDGGNAAAPVIHKPIYNHETPSPPIYSHAEQSATDALFTAQSQDEQPPLPVAAVVVSASLVNLKAVVIDQAKKETNDEEEEERPMPPRLRNDHDNE